MKTTFCLKVIFFCSYLLWYSISNFSLAQNRFEQGKKWYNQRAAKADSFIVQPQNITNAIQAFEESQQESPSKETAIFLLKSYYFKGMYTGLDEGQQKEIYEEGRTFGEAMAERYPKSAAVKFWYGANIGRWAEAHGFLASATSGVAKKLRSLCHDIIKLDPAYQGGGGYRILAQVHFFAPEIPIFMSWPSDEKALELMKKAVETAPDHPSNRLLFAKILLNFDQKEKAKIQLDYLIKKMEPRATYLAEDRFVKYRAQKLLKEHYGRN